MALFKYFAHQTDKTQENQAQLVEISRVDDNTEKSKKRGNYQKLSPEEKARVGKYACEHGMAAALRHFKEMGLKETSVRDWRNAYQKIVNEKSKDAKVGEAIVIKTLPGKKRGRPPILGCSLDEKLQEMIHSLRERQTAISSTVVAGLGWGLLLKYNKTLLSEYGGPLELNKSWAHSVLRRMDSPREGQLRSQN